MCVSREADASANAGTRRGRALIRCARVVRESRMVCACDSPSAMNSSNNSQICFFVRAFPHKMQVELTKTEDSAKISARFGQGGEAGDAAPSPPPTVAPDAHLQVLSSLLEEVQELTLSRYESSGALSLPTIADRSELVAGVRTLTSDLPTQGWGLERSGRYLLDKVAPTLGSGQSAGTRYFGFVTGGVLPVAALADNLVTLYDANVQVHLPNETLSTLIEDHTITLLLQLLSLPREEFTGAITTGATTANILALACAREAVLQRRLGQDFSFADEGYSAATPSIDVFVATPHASIKKAAAVVGIGRKRVVDVGRKPARGGDDAAAKLTTEAGVAEGVVVVEFDLEALESHLKTSHTAGRPAIIVAGMGEVNTGALTAQLPTLRQLCDRYEAWLHVDAAFSAFVGLLDGHEWVCQHMAACADSITSDGHKQLNVPYDAGLLFIRRPKSPALPSSSLLEDVCGPGKGQAAPSYLKASIGGDTGHDGSGDDDEATRSAYAASLPSPLFKNLENSKRFRALPLYAVLLSEGRQGIKAMVQRNVAFRQAVETWMRDGGGRGLYQVLTPRGTASETSPSPWAGPTWNTTILLFRPNPEGPWGTDTPAFIDAVKATRAVYISPTTWNGVAAARLAVSNWRTGLEAADGRVVDRVEDSEDYRVVTETLRRVGEKRD